VLSQPVVLRTPPQGPPGPQGIPGQGVPLDLSADCLGTDEIGDFVYVTGDTVLGRHQVTRVDVDDVGAMPAIGVITAKATATECTVRRFGDVAAVGLTPGGVYFVDTDSQIKLGPPVHPPVGTRHVQRVGVAIDSTTLMLESTSNIIRILPS